MRILIFVFVVLFSTNILSYPHQLLDSEWLQFKAKYNKIYSSIDEEIARYNIFQSNLNKINEHNRLYDEGVVSYKIGINQFADMTHDEWAKNSLGVITPSASQGRILKRSIISEERKSEVDWRESGVVTPVKNQGACGSSWSFAAVGTLESQIAIKTGILIPLNEQDLINCSFSNENNSCSGGSVDLAYQQIINNDILSKQQSPYDGDRFTCEYVPDPTVVNVVNFTVVPSGADNILSAVENIGPLAILLDVTTAFQFYSSGIFDDQSCSGDKVNHAALLVGYGPNYWLVKNSWGPNWGEAGYIRIAQNGDGCGITVGGSYPVLN